MFGSPLLGLWSTVNHRDTRYLVERTNQTFSGIVKRLVSEPDRYIHHLAGR